MDVCCLNRPFDDFSQERIFLEAEAILTIITRCERGEWTLLVSSVIDYELSQLQDEDRLEKVQTLYDASKEWYSLSSDAEKRAKQFQQYGIKSLDSFHLALAETQKADIFLTTDMRLLRAVHRIELNIKVSNPLTWLMEMIWNE
jgi:predicted nucleic acid-binding protein